MNTVLCLLALGFQSGPPGYSPYSPYTDLGYSSSPAYQSVQWGATFTQTATVTDFDTWKQDGSNPPAFLTVANSATGILPTPRSGTFQQPANESYNNGTRTMTWTVTGLSLPQESTQFVDDFTMFDTQTSPLHDTNTAVSHNYVSYPSPNGNGGSGG